MHTLLLTPEQRAALSAEIAMRGTPLADGTRTWRIHSVARFDLLTDDVIELIVDCPDGSQMSTRIDNDRAIRGDAHLETIVWQLACFCQIGTIDRHIQTAFQITA